MSARYTIWLRQDPRGWQWSLTKGEASWWGFYRTEGLARGAAKRATTKTPGKKTDPRDYEFILVKGGAA